jgi:GNAT superfamily N-acetyltransferase
MDVPIRLAREDELDAVSALIARSFHAEPFMAWVSGGDPERLARFAALAVRRVADDVLVDDGLTTAALVVRPGGLDIAPLEQLRMLPALVRSASLRRLPAVLRALIRLEREHPEVPHATLIALGVEPAEQARGRGSAMLAAVERHAGVPVYLETAPSTSATAAGAAATPPAPSSASRAAARASGRSCPGRPRARWRRT